MPTEAQVIKRGIRWGLSAWVMANALAQLLAIFWGSGSFGDKFSGASFWANLPGSFLVGVLAFAIYGPEGGGPPWMNWVAPLAFMLAGALTWTLIITVIFGVRYLGGAADPTVCRNCGYDLRGTIAAGRSQCPECGASISG